MRQLYDGDDAKHLEEIVQISEQKSKKYGKMAFYIKKKPA